MMHRLQTIGSIEESIAPPFTLPSARDGKPVSLNVLRQRQPVALLFVASSGDVPSVIQRLTERLSDFRDVGSAVLVVVRESPSTVPEAFPVLVDDAGQVFRQYGCLSERDVFLFGLDRYGAVVHQDASPAEQLESALRRLLESIQFSEMQCPECGI